MVTVIPLMVAIDVSSIEYVKEPPLFDDGTVMSNASFPYVLAILGNTANDGVAT